MLNWVLTGENIKLAFERMMMKWPIYEIIDMWWLKFVTVWDWQIMMREMCFGSKLGFYVSGL